MIERFKSMRSAQMLAEKNEEEGTLKQEKVAVPDLEARVEVEEAVVEDEVVAVLYSEATEEELSEVVRENAPKVRDVKMVDPEEFTTMRPLIKEVVTEDSHPDNNIMMMKVTMINSPLQDVVATSEEVALNKEVTTTKTVLGIRTNITTRDNPAQGAVNTGAKGPDLSQIAAVVTKAI